MQPWTASPSLAWYHQNPTRHQTRAIADALARVVHAMICIQSSGGAGKNRAPDPKVSVVKCIKQPKRGGSIHEESAFQTLQNHLALMLIALFCLPEFFFARLGLFWGSPPMSSRTPANLPMHGQTGVWTHDPECKWPNWQGADFNIFPSRTATSQSQDQTMSNNQTTTSGQALGFGVLGCT